jgi:hypothetical protein
MSLELVRFLEKLGAKVAILDGIIVVGFIC